MLFTDAHSGSAVCSPSRYGILTGRYAWRSRLKKGIVKKWERSLIEKDRLTLPEMLRKNGYITACIGKWHLGWDWPRKGGGYTEIPAEIDFSAKIGGGPLAAGFDTYFGDDVPNWPPFTWIQDDRVTEIPTENLKFPTRYHTNNGIGAKNWNMEAVLPTITRRCVEFIDSSTARNKPFFLYFAMTSPHTPIAPSKEFLGKSRISRYADFLMETDACIGKIIKAVDSNDISGNTIIIFTADNGTSGVCNFAHLKTHGTDLQNHWRGMKSDGFEGGHRVPFIVRWSGHIPAGSCCQQVISQVDIMATCADIIGFKLPDNAAEDSASLWPVLSRQDPDTPVHEAIVCHSIYGVFVIRKNNWKLQLSAGSGGWSYPRDDLALKKGLPKWQLYDLANDPKETENLFSMCPEKVKVLNNILQKYIRDGRSVPLRSSN
jgi:arylsulfatase A-like enzyme